MIKLWLEFSNIKKDNESLKIAGLLNYFCKKGGVKKEILRKRKEVLDLTINHQRMSEILRKECFFVRFSGDLYFVLFTTS